MKTLELASDVIAGSTAFAGLIIVYVGAVSAAYGSYTTESQDAVRGQFKKKATFASAGICVAALAASMAILGKWASCNGAVAISVVLLVLTLLWGVAVTIQTVREIG